MRPNEKPSVLLLSRAIRIARRLEKLASTQALSSPLTFVGYGFLVQNCRLAASIQGFDRAYSHEALILIRTMFEILINYHWIRLKKSHSRAVRFLRYEPIEELKCVEAMRTAFPDATFLRVTNRLRRERSKTRHLFRYRDAEGKLRWAESWAVVKTFEGRLREVRKSASPPPVDEYLYGLYRWWSSVVHGGAHSIKMLLAPNGAVKPSREPLGDPDLAAFLGFTLLTWTIDLLASDLDLSKALKPELPRLIQHLKRRIASEVRQ